jgi:hypothetical protein
MPDADAARRAHAAALLGDPTLMARIRAQIAALDALADPAMMVIAGVERLGGARRLGLLAGSPTAPARMPR